MLTRAKGFTLIEIIAVLIVLAILAKFAVSRYIDLTSNAQTSSVKSVAAALASASANNFAARTASGSNIGSAISNCSQIGNLLTGGLPSGYTISTTAITAGSSQSCTLTGPNSTSAIFNGLGIS